MDALGTAGVENTEGSRNDRAVCGFDGSSTSDARSFSSWDMRDA